MSEKQGIEASREYRFKEFLRYTRTKPYACQPLMKQFYQCFDFYHFQKNEGEEEAKAKCFEKFNYEECFTENKDKLRENWQLNLEDYEYKPDYSEEGA
jgi:hypothetical protein